MKRGTLKRGTTKGSTKADGKSATPTGQGPVPGEEISSTSFSSFVSKPAVRRRVYSDARAALGHLRSNDAQTTQGIFKEVALSMSNSFRKAAQMGDVVAKLSGVEEEPSRRPSVISVSKASRASSQEEDIEDEVEKTRRRFREALAEVRQLLESADVSSTLQEVAQVASRVKELQELIETAGLGGSKVEEAQALAALEDRINSTLETASSHARPSASPEAEAPMPALVIDLRKAYAGLKGARSLEKKRKGRKKSVAQEPPSRDLVTQRLRSNPSAWTQLPPPRSARELRSRESWLKWWHVEDEGDILDRIDAFFESLPPGKLTHEEMELRDSIIDFLERKGKDRLLEEIKVQPMIVRCAKKLLPAYVSLEEWLHRRQCLSHGGAAPMPWRLDGLDPHERWKKDLPIEPPAEEPAKFQRRDSTQRRGSSVFGINFEVTDHGQIFGHVAGDDETICELPWPCSSVVPEQKNFAWIKDLGIRRSLPAVASRRNMTVEDVMAWRLSHRFRQRRVEPVLQSMWQALRRERPPKPCSCEHCSGTLHYHITLAAEQ